MDNNSNNNFSGISNVSDIKFDDTPAQSFENLYGGSNQSVSNVNMVQPGMTPNPGTNPGVQGPSMAPNPGMNPGVQGPSMASNPGMNLGVQGPSMVPNPGMNPGVQGPSMTPNPGMNPGVQGPSMAPNPGMNPGVQGPGMALNPGMNPGVQGPSMAPNPGMNPGVQGPSMTPNPGTIIQPVDTGISNMNIDEDRMQSIEEQLSKTSQYNPDDIQKEMISISSDNKSDKSKSGLAFVIVLFIILALVIAFLPQITKLIK